MPNIKSQITPVASVSTTDAVPQSRNIFTTSPLAGGGNLSTDLTLSLDTTTFGDVFSVRNNTLTGINTFTQNAIVIGDVQVSGVLIAYSAIEGGGTLNLSPTKTTRLQISDSSTPFALFTLPVYGTSLIGASRYVTSGELKASTGTFDPTASIYWTGTQHVFSAGTSVTFSGQTQFGVPATGGLTVISAAGDVQVSGTLVAYSVIEGGGTLNLAPTQTTRLQISDSSTPFALFTVPVYSTALVGANRYLSSGELNSGAGSGDFVKSSANFVTGSPIVFGPNTLVQVSGVLRVTGATQISGTLLGYGTPNDTLIIGAAGDGTSPGVLMYGQNTAPAGTIFTVLGSGSLTGQTTFLKQFGQDVVIFNAIPVFYTANANVQVSGNLIAYRRTELGGGDVVVSPTGDLQVSGLLLAYSKIIVGTVGSNTITTSGNELVLQQTGDAFGTTRLRLRNRTNFNGPVFEQGGSVDLVDFTFSSLTQSRNIRLEARPAQVVTTAPEFQIGTAGSPAFVTSDKKNYTTNALYNYNFVGGALTGTNRYLTSGEIAAGAGTGTVTNIKPGSNIVLAPSPITATGTIGVVPNPVFSSLIVTGDTQISGNNGLQLAGALGGYGTLALRGNMGNTLDMMELIDGTGIFSDFNPIYGGSVITSTSKDRYIVSGELTPLGDVQVSGTMITYGNVRTADIQVSGTMVVYGSIFGANGGLATQNLSLGGGNTEQFRLSGFNKAAIFLVPVYGTSATGANRYVTSGELKTGTGTFDPTASEYWTGAQHVFSASTTITASGVSQFGTAANGGATIISPAGDVQVSGQLLTYEPAYNNSATAANRYVVSGELADLSISRTTGATVLLSGITYQQAASYAVPANQLGTQSQLRMRVLGTLRHPGGNVTLSIRAVYGNSVLASGTFSSATTSSADEYFRTEIFLAGDGSTSRQVASVESLLNSTIGVATTSGVATVPTAIALYGGNYFVREDSTQPASLVLYTALNTFTAAPGVIINSVAVDFVP